MTANSDSFLAAWLLLRRSCEERKSQFHCVVLYFTPSERVPLARMSTSFSTATTASLTETTTATKDNNSNSTSTTTGCTKIATNNKNNNNNGMIHDKADFHNCGYEIWVQGRARWRAPLLLGRCYCRTRQRSRGTTDSTHIITTSQTSWEAIQSSGFWIAIWKS